MKMEEARPGITELGAAFRVRTPLIFAPSTDVPEPKRRRG